MAAKTDHRGKILTLAKSVAYSKDSVVSKTFLHKTVGTITLFAFDKGQGLSEHTAPYDASVFIVEGEAELVIGGESVKPKAGDFVIMPAKVPHSVKATKKFKMLLIMIRA